MKIKTSTILKIIGLMRIVRNNHENNLETMYYKYYRNNNI